MSRLRLAVQTLAALAVLASLVVLVWSAISTSSARVNASTSGTSFFSAGVVDLAQPDTVVELLFDADGLHPGVEVTGCIEVEYRGSIPASVRLHAARRGGSGLEEFVDVRVGLSSAGSCSGDENSPTSAVFRGRLEDLWTTHGSYERALVLDPAMVSGDRIVIHASASVIDDNRAQGLTTDFALIVEARP